jgi:hypothetical protein
MSKITSQEFDHGQHHMTAHAEEGGPDGGGFVIRTGGHEQVLKIAGVNWLQIWAG